MIKKKIEWSQFNNDFSDLGISALISEASYYKKMIASCAKQGLIEKDLAIMELQFIKHLFTEIKILQSNFKSNKLLDKLDKLDHEINNKSKDIIIKFIEHFKDFEIWLDEENIIFA